MPLSSSVAVETGREGSVADQAHRHLDPEIIPVDGRRTDTRRRLVEAATRLFSAKGYDATSVAELEGAVGLRAGCGGLYRHFESKEKLLEEVVFEYKNRVSALRDRLAREREQGHKPYDLASELRKLITELAGFLSGEQAIIQLTSDSNSLPTRVRGLIGDAWNEGYAMAQDIFVACGVDPQRASVLAISAIGSLNHYVGHLGLGGRPPLDLVLERYLDEWIDLWTSQSAQDSPLGPSSI